MKNRKLLENLRAFGYPLLEKEEAPDANKALAEVVKSGELRLWEGFPLLLANAADKGAFSYESVDGYLKKPSDKKTLKLLLLVSFALYKMLNVKFSWAGKLMDELSLKRSDYEQALRRLKKNKELKVINKALSAERLKNTFTNYFKEKESSLKEYASMKEGFELEYLLSQVFSAKQKELFFKKLKGEKMTKTEKEYYSRAVKKKVMALANSELHKLAQQIK